MYTCTASAEAFSRMASSISTAMRSFESSFKILCPPVERSTTGFDISGGMELRSAPRVIISASAKGMSGTMVMSMRSRPVVGPWKYP